jgi:hypothetical protein
MHMGIRKCLHHSTDGCRCQAHVCTGRFGLPAPHVAIVIWWKFDVWAIIVGRKLATRKAPHGCCEARQWLIPSGSSAHTSKQQVCGYLGSRLHFLAAQRALDIGSVRAAHAKCASGLRRPWRLRPQKLQNKKTYGGRHQVEVYLSSNEWKNDTFGEQTTQQRMKSSRPSMCSLTFHM